MLEPFEGDEAKLWLVFIDLIPILLFRHFLLKSKFIGSPTEIRVGGVQNWT